MPIYHSEIEAVLAELAKGDPRPINHALLLELVEQFEPLLEAVLPGKRSGYELGAYLYVQLYQAISQLSYKNFAEDLNDLFKLAGVSFQKAEAETFRNGKTRRASPG